MQKASLRVCGRSSSTHSSVGPACESAPAELLTSGRQQWRTLQQLRDTQCGRFRTNRLLYFLLFTENLFVSASFCRCFWPQGHSIRSSICPIVSFPFQMASGCKFQFVYIQQVCFMFVVQGFNLAARSFCGGLTLGLS